MPFDPLFVNNRPPPTADNRGLAGCRITPIREYDKDANRDGRNDARRRRNHGE